MTTNPGCENRNGLVVVAKPSNWRRREIAAKLESDIRAIDLTVSAPHQATMADVLLHARSFTKPHLEINGSYRIPVTLRTYLRAALTVSFQNGIAARRADRAIRKYHLKSGDGLFGFFVKSMEGFACNPRTLPSRALRKER